MNTDLKNFKAEIYKYGVIVALLMEIISIPFIGIEVKFLYGLVLGIAISIVNFEIMSFTYAKAIRPKGNAAFVFIGYIVRLAIYGFAFYTAVKVSLATGIGALLGFVALKIGIYYSHGFKAKFSQNRKVSDEVKKAYEDEDRKKKKVKWKKPFSYESDEEFFKDDNDDSEEK